MTEREQGEIHQLLAVWSEVLKDHETRLRRLERWMFIVTGAGMLLAPTVHAIIDHWRT